ncbi:hypothetical protein [Roseomonas sp. CECT 9278]|uniref:hypothetical protein n=1 Tax=Roseomonas sp. CECT 9278 TaxID=2845823 RepID=UPI001E5EE067|nr:hypothetical protein [Roseomonas sp. CECT 9278]CAH0158698.1 hypothetical protein ROS9278_00908 [Roseomonas sp. CECT 9278]
MNGAGFGEEQARLGASQDTDDLVEMVNLPTRYTGISGTVFISTAMGAHGPRVKWFPGKAGRDLPCLVVTLEMPPRALNEGLPVPVARDGERLVTPWVESNRAALLHFWREGTSWDVDEVRAFVVGLSRMG